ncbi:hypothetical protein MCOR25_009512 [Pyricularia grisea]|uniref:Methyltransferase domain-containing protein n=1 Tax=Pyricularia grisea TaxID=148305 RepID=A0A6P8ATV3_PYRGI|nr:uncharacterized protein PgNI_09124 [Pyricularia grisea]KAI6352179.1 hypothetical protein MCOR25_009512 [Pyricularia grisea]TLD05561.1 hypothetical protein PgNI_09124 [Pyricularia grisea]
MPPTHGVNAVPEIGTDFSADQAPREYNDYDSAIGDIDRRSDRYGGTLRDTVLEYRVENGRTYHSLKEGSYWQPNDEASQERLDLAHNLFVITFDNRLCMCPKNERARYVLDVGTGTGIWACDFADEHPEAHVVGVDLSPIQPHFVPTNCRFIIDDIESEWLFDDKFDLVFIRNMLGSFESWQNIFERAYGGLESGGYLEVQDCCLPIKCDDGTLPEDAVISHWCQLMLQAAERAGRPIDVTPKLADLMRQVGFVDVTVKKRRWPHAPWPRDRQMRLVGWWAREVSISDLDGMCMKLLMEHLGWTIDEVKDICAKVKDDCDNLRYHAYWDVYSIYGRKPA